MFPGFKAVSLGIALYTSGSAAALQTVKTTSGQLQGRLASGTTGVVEYLGIPYAQPPVGRLRWAPPEPFSGSGVIDATEFGYTCPANATFAPNSELTARSKEFSLTEQAPMILENLLEQEELEYSEDCLTLNVWTRPTTSDTKKAVLFWIYGGGFKTGSTNVTGYNGKYIADLEDVVIVSANYRLNIFGFPGNPNIRNNLGLLDQRLAVEWVRDNIEAFGGDPNRITLFGQSAGGESVDFYSFAWTSDPIVAGFIAESGTVLSPSAQEDASTAAKAWYNVTATLGCGDESSEPDALLSCMRLKDWETVQNAIPITSGISGVTGSFVPTIDNIVIFDDYAARLEAGNFIYRPLFLGNNNNEIGLFRPIFESENLTLSDAQWDYLNWVLYTCPASYRASGAVSSNVPTWRYRYFGEFPNLRLTINPDSGAWHGSEVLLIFNTDMGVQNIVDRTPEEGQIAEYLRKAWVSFANDPENGLTKYGFPRYNPLESTLLRLAYNNETGPQPTYPATYDTGCVIGTTLAEILITLESL
ncbi:putative carboxylesterase [Talaromyces proteolyticus]|uniref:Carboxylic ester hydrolase n=1 Tax=Talaromyces proteolyticus TaxID=1131652 RepID=A0AAD4KZN0_9EURO|nr:putative carboxylesterase [Talaromyces proteolyticus]KAH8703544.1 putative carboxylesterase [Talaromyces proteolyticus]